MLPEETLHLNSNCRGEKEANSVHIEAMFVQMQHVSMVKLLYDSVNDVML